MKRHLSILLAAILCAAVVSPCAVASDLFSRPMDEKELVAIKAQLKRPGVADAWVLTGNESFDTGTGCLSRRTLYIYSKPTVIQAKLLITSVTELLFKAAKQTPAGCADLVLKNEIHRRVGKYIGKKPGNEMIVAHDVSGFFNIRGQVNEKQLIVLKNVIDAIPTCASGNKSCDSIALDIRLPNDAMSRLEKVRTANVSSVEGQISPDGNGPFILLFRPYEAKDLIVFVSELMKDRPLVQVTYLVQ